MTSTRALGLALALGALGACVAVENAGPDGTDIGCAGEKCDGPARAFGALGAFAGVRADGVTAVLLDARKNTYTRIGVFTIFARFEPRNASEDRAAPTADHFQAAVAGERLSGRAGHAFVEAACEHARAY